MNRRAGCAPLAQGFDIRAGTMISPASPPPGSER